jgi:hypothetical protein
VAAGQRRISVTLKPDYALKLANLAERTHVQERTLAVPSESESPVPNQPHKDGRLSAGEFLLAIRMSEFVEQLRGDERKVEDRGVKERAAQAVRLG